MSEEEKINGENNYSASNIQVLEGLEAVRKTSRHVYRRHQRKGIAPLGLRGCGQLLSTRHWPATVII